jgi:purine-nucleoside phosphorylase
MHEAVYAWWLGPSFETPAEVRMIEALGADVVGMSTVPEAIAARHMGAHVVGFSLVTNRAAGLAAGHLSAEEVLGVAADARPRVELFLSAFLARAELAGGD